MWTETTKREKPQSEIDCENKGKTNVEKKEKPGHCAYNMFASKKKGNTEETANTKDSCSSLPVCSKADGTTAEDIKCTIVTRKAADESTENVNGVDQEDAAKDAAKDVRHVASAVITLVLALHTVV
jgi:hypothetical protein